MSLIVEQSTKQFTLAEEGMVNGVLAAVQDLGLVAGQYGTKHKVRLVWVIDGQFDEEKRPVIVLQSLTASMHEKASLRKTVRDILGNDPGDGAFDLDSIVGSSKQLLIEHNSASDGRKFANVRAILKATKKVAIPANFVAPKVKAAVAVQAGSGPQAAALPYQATDQDVSF